MTIPEGWNVWKHGTDFMREHRIKQSIERSAERGQTPDEFIEEFDYMDWYAYRANDTPRPTKEQIEAQEYLNANPVHLEGRREYVVKTKTQGD